MRRTVTTGLVAALIALAGCSGESRLTQGDIDWCVDFLNVSKMGGYPTAELLPTSTTEYVLKTSSGLERVDWWQESTPHLYDIANIPWESSKMKRLGSKADKLWSQGSDTFMDSRDPDEWRKRLDEAETLRDELLLSCGG
jgi:hypothetical protein